MRKRGAKLTNSSNGKASKPRATTDLSPLMPVEDILLSTNNGWGNIRAIYGARGLKHTTSVFSHEQDDWTQQMSLTTNRLKMKRHLLKLPWSWNASSTSSHQAVLTNPSPLIVTVRSPGHLVSRAGGAQWITLPTAAAVWPGTLVLAEVTTHQGGRVVAGGCFWGAAVNAGHACKGVKRKRSSSHYREHWFEPSLHYREQRSQFSFHCREYSGLHYRKHRSESTLHHRECGSESILH